MSLNIIDLTIIISLILIALIDARTLIIPDRLSFFIIGVASLRIIFLNYEDMVDNLLGGLVSFAIFEAARRIMSKFLNRDALGIGDVKLMIGGGLWVGLSHLPSAILIACFGGLFHFGILALFNKMQIGEHKIPFGPYLVAGILTMKLPFILEIESLLTPF